MERIGGVANVFADGRSLPIRGNLTVSPDPSENQVVAGMDGVHGYNERPRAPFIQGDFSTKANVNLRDVARMTNVTVTAELANGKTFVLVNATRTTPSEINASEGSFTIRWEGESCREV